MTSSLVLPALVAALSVTPITPTPVSPDTVLPGDRRVDARRIRASADSIDWTLERDGQQRPFGAAADIVSRTTRDGAPVLLRVNRVSRGPAMLIDSTWSDPTTLAPIAHRASQPQRSLVVDWRGRSLSARIERRGGTPIVRDTTWQVATFDSSNWDLVIRALDLRVGTTWTFPVYDVDGLLQWYSATVKEEAMRAGRPVVVVDASLGTAGNTTLVIDRETRAMIETRVPMGQAVLRMSIVAPAGVK